MAPDAIITGVTKSAVADPAQDIIFSEPAAGPPPPSTGPEFGNLITCENATAEYFIHNGITSSIKTTFDLSPDNAQGITNDGTKVILILAFNRIDVMTGYNDTVDFTFATEVGSMVGLTILSGDLIASTFGPDNFYRYAGITSSLSETINTPLANCLGITHLGSDLISQDRGSGGPRLFEHDGFSESINSTLLPLPGTRTGTIGLANDGSDNLIYGNSSEDLIRVQVGFTLTTNFSFAAPSTFIAGVTVGR